MRRESSGGTLQLLQPRQTRDGRPMRPGNTPAILPGGEDTFASYGTEWANAPNTPFRRYKHWVHEGGIATPLIAHWPKGIPAERRGGLVKDPGHLIDVMATCLDLSAAKYPADKLPPEGVSLRPAFEGKPLARKQPIFWEHEGNHAVRDGKWKLVAKHGKPWELYDMEADRVELYDLAAREPDKAKELAAAWDAWAKRVGVRPWDEISPKKKKKG